MLGLAAMTSSDLFHCFKVIFDNIVLTWTYFKVSLYTEGELAYLQMDTIRDLGESLQYLIERDLSAAWLVANEALNRELPLISVEFKHPETSYQEKSWLEEPLEKSDPTTSRIFASQCRDIAASLVAKQSFAEHIRYHLLNSSFETPSLESVARVFKTTPRTIQRKLAAENISFQEFLDDVRKSVSIEYLLNTLTSVEQIAERIGYNDAAAFSNGFKRWTGVSPTSYRKTH